MDAGLGVGLGFMALKECEETPQSDTEKVNFSEYADLLKSRVPGATEFNLISEFGRSLFTKYAFSISKVETVKDWGDRITALTHFGSNQVLFNALICLPIRKVHFLFSFCVKCIFQMYGTIECQF